MVEAAGSPLRFNEGRRHGALDALHDLRRAVRSGLGTLGVDPNIAELILNHATGAELRAVYDRADYWPQRAEALARWSRHVRSFSQTGSASNILPLRAAIG
jgi:hypothetical protein